MENVSNKLQEIFSEIRGALKSVQTAAKQNPRDVINFARIIEKGEKRIAKEYAKRMTEYNTLASEMLVLANFADEMGYKLHDEPEETELSEVDPESVPTSGIKVNLGEV